MRIETKCLHAGYQPKNGEPSVMPIVQIDMLEGRTVEQKRELVKRVTKVVAETTNCSADVVTILIRDLPFENIGKAGKLQIDM